ncbi:hypothetical protein IU447_13470 [Nocardia farcinica]|uniref:Uncharacterized protein n=1 Tax=Nocardia farcinica TaxID=37329 RepID=A0A449H7K8_NOCFR|nr:hypothetical protein [Nocardia farcinica]MBF6361123.1 hypothetical protein [Nocardia farcinica]VFA94049.1 Uncharacterised protein [Nocardia farcinica]
MSEVRGRDRDTLGLATRVKALAIADPVLDLERRKTLLNSRDWTGYQMEELALTAIDTVTLRMDFDDGAQHEDVVAAVARVAGIQMPDRGTGEHIDVARWVLDCLVNVGTVDRGFNHVYGVAVDGTYSSRVFSFKLLREVPGPDGKPRLRASNEAIAVLVGAVDIDIASEQIAADAKLDALVKRARLSDAYRAAEMALRLTAQYAEHIRTQLDAMARDIRSVDWIRDVQRTQTEALSHIEDRINAENTIKNNLAGMIEKSTEETTPAQAADLIAILDECLRRHAALQANLQEVGERFRAEQERQTFVPPPLRSCVDLGHQLLRPTLELPTQQATPLLNGFAATVAPPRRPAVIYLPDLIAGLMTVPTENDGDDGLIVEPEFDDTADIPAFSDEQYSTAESMIDSADATGIRLSALLAAARRTAVSQPGQLDLDHLVALHVLGLFGAPRHNADDDALLAAQLDEQQLDDERFAGDDLLVVRTPAGDAASADHSEKDTV